MGNHARRGRNRSFPRATSSLRSLVGYWRYRFAVHANSAAPRLKCRIGPLRLLDVAIVCSAIAIREHFWRVCVALSQRLLVSVFLPGGSRRVPVCRHVSGQSRCSIAPTADRSTKWDQPFPSGREGSFRLAALRGFTGIINCELPSSE